MPKVGENWKCPYCGLGQVVSEDRFRTGGVDCHKDGWKPGAYAHLQAEFIICANQECRELTLAASLWPYTLEKNQRHFGNCIKTWGLLPPSTAKPQPDYIPPTLRTDYEEACAIRDLSPKASATVIRRCLQGMIRDFCGISKRRLVDEIGELRKRIDDGRAPPGVQPDTVDAIDYVRKIGNIGAHMEADINVIVDVDPSEAQILIELTELLFAEWYVARDTRQNRMKQLGLIADEKTALQKQLPPPSSGAS